MSNRVIEAVVRLSARLGSLAAFSQLGAKLAAVNKQAAVFNLTQTAMASSSRRAMAAAARYLAPAALAYGAAAAGREFATLERRLTRIGINADASGEAMQGAMDRIRTIADDLHTPVDNVVMGLESLIASGKSLDEAMALLSSVSATAQAADADFGAMAATADAISASFDIAADKMSGAFDIIAMGGKAGKFELKDMASELPSLAPAFAALGYKGEEGLKRLTAALQVVRMEVGTSGEAATSFMDVISKMEGDTVSNNFKKFGINIRKEMKRARTAGEDTLEAFIRLAHQAVKGDMSKLPQLFTDKQMLIGMRALMNRLPELRGMIGDLGNAAGTVMRDNERLAKDTQATFDDMANSWDRLKKSIGEGVAPLMTPVMETVSDKVDALVNRDKENDIIKAYADEKGLSNSERLGLLMPGYIPGLGDKDEDERRRAGILWEKGIRTDADRKLIEGYRQGGTRQVWRDTPERDGADGPEIRAMPEIGPRPRFYRNADGSETAAASPPSAVAPVPHPTPRPNEVDLAIDRADEARRRLRETSSAIGQYGQYRSAAAPVPLVYAPPAYQPPRTKGGYSDVAPMPHLARPTNDLSVKFGDFDSVTKAIAEQLREAGDVAASNLSRGGGEAATAMTAAAPHVGAAIADSAMERMRVAGAVAGTSFRERTAAPPDPRDMASDRTQTPAMRNVGDLLRSLEDAGSAVGSDLARGGGEAAQAMTSAAPQVGAAIGDAAAAKIAADAAIAGTAFGNAAAARIREAAGSIKIQAVAAPRPGGVSGNPGKAMPGAGETVATP